MGIHKLVYVNCDRCGGLYPYGKTTKVDEERLCQECCREAQGKEKEEGDSKSWKWEMGDY